MAETVPKSRYDSMTRQRGFAWAKYYEAVRGRLEADYRNYNRMRTMDERSDSMVPPHIVAELKEMADALKKTWECPICLEMITPDRLAITPCGHFYCGGCLGDMCARARNAGNDKVPCAVCRRKISTREPTAPPS